MVETNEKIFFTGFFSIDIILVYIQFPVIMYFYFWVLLFVLSEQLTLEMGMASARFILKVPSGTSCLLA